MSQFLVSSLLQIDLLLVYIKEAIDSAKDTPPVMTTQVETPAPVLDVRRGSSDLPPGYSTTEPYELAPLTPASSLGATLPEYTPLSPSSFSPTKCFQIQAPGTPVIRLPFPPRPDPIYILSVTPDGEAQQPEYVSIRPARDSGSCFLTRVDDAEQTVLCATTYRFGPGRPPRMRIPSQIDDSSSDSEFELSCKGCLTRTVVMRTHLGTFEWRYSTRSERRDAYSTIGEEVDCLMILDKVTSVALAGGKQEERRSKTGQFVRSTSLRTPGSKKSSAGNGGRLMLDLRAWVDSKGDRQQMEILAVASCVSMMKKEVDRRRMHQAMAFSGGGGG